MKRHLSALLILVLCLVLPARADTTYTITLSPANGVTLRVGDRYTFKVAIEPVNLMEHALSWRSDNQYIASVDAKGTVQAKAAGQTTITCQMENHQSVQAIVTVTGNAVTTLTLDTSEVNLEVGERYTITHQINADADERRVLWSTADPSIASISSKGVITGVASGTTVVTATAVNGMTASAIVTVPSDVERISLDPEQFSLAPGDTRSLDAYVFPGNARNRDLTWESSKTNIATVDANGVVTAVAMGKALIRAKTANGVYGLASVVVEPQATSVTLNTSTLLLSRAQRTAKLTARFTPMSAADSVHLWSSADESVCTVSDEGVVTAVNYGETTVTVRTLNGQSATCAIRVAETAVRITFAQPTMALSLDGAPVALFPALLPENADRKGLIWTSSAPHIAQVSESGVVVAQSAGQCVIRAASASGVYAEVHVTVTMPIEALHFDRSEIEVYAYTATALPLVITPPEASTLLVWSVGDSALAYIAPDGTLYAKQEGQTVITVATPDGAFSESIRLAIAANPVRSPRYLALTFDNGPDAYTEDILSILGEYGIRATFFLLGDQLTGDVAVPDYGTHELGNHTSQNRSLNVATRKEALAAISLADARIVSATGRKATVLRAPDAALSRKTIDMIGDSRIFIGTTLPSQDVRQADAESIAATVRYGARDRAIVGFHDVCAQTPEALRLLIPDLLLQGYEFVTVSELMALTDSATPSAVFAP